MQNFCLFAFLEKFQFVFRLHKKKAKENEHCNGTRLNYYFELQMEGKNNFSLTLKRELFLDTSLQMGDILKSYYANVPFEAFPIDVLRFNHNILEILIFWNTKHS